MTAIKYLWIWEFIDEDGESMSDGEVYAETVDDAIKSVPEHIRAGLPRGWKDGLTVKIDGTAEASILLVGPQKDRELYLALTNEIEATA